MSLDVPEPQILIAYPEDPAFTWHHRVLLRRLTGATWVVLTPDEEVQVEDLSHHSVIAMARNSPVPADVGDDCYLCPSTVSTTLDVHHASAQRLAEILVPDEKNALASPTVPGVTWRVADTSLSSFGEVVDADLVNSGSSGVVRGSVGLARVGADSEWTFVEKVNDDDLAAWQAEKQSGGGRDRRLGVIPPPAPFDGSPGWASA